jgi:uncharacterized membrane protein
MRVRIEGLEVAWIISHNKDANILTTYYNPLRGNMENLLDNMGEKKFRSISAILCFIGDFLVAWFIYYILTAQQMCSQIVGSFLQQRGFSVSEIETDMIRHLEMNCLNSGTMLITLFLFVHLIVYILHALDKKFATRYVKVTIWITLPTSAWFIYESWFIHKGFALAFIISTPLYYFCYRGIKKFKLGVKQVQKIGTEK